MWNMIIFSSRLSMHWWRLNMRVVFISSFWITLESSFDSSSVKQQHSVWLWRCPRLNYTDYRDLVPLIACNRIVPVVACRLMSHAPLIWLVLYVSGLTSRRRSPPSCLVHVYAPYPLWAGFIYLSSRGGGGCWISEHEAQLLRRRSHTLRLPGWMCVSLARVQSRKHHGGLPEPSGDAHRDAAAR